MVPRGIKPRNRTWDALPFETEGQAEAFRKRICCYGTRLLGRDVCAANSSKAVHVVAVDEDALNRPRRRAKAYRQAEMAFA